MICYLFVTIFFTVATKMSTKEPDPDQYVIFINFLKVWWHDSTVFVCL